MHAWAQGQQVARQHRRLTHGMVDSVPSLATPVLIVGAGPVGLSAAILLTMASCSCARTAMWPGVAAVLQPNN
jgi:ribulose 1,5-bisphosphate synthetase/thiazole synthase